MWFGVAHYGKVDVVKGRCYVVTQFAHINFIPLYPIDSYVVVDRSKRAVRLGLVAKSVALGWLRAVSLVALAIAIAIVAARPAWAFEGAAIGATSLFVIFGTRFIPGLGRATPRQAERLCRIAGIQEPAQTGGSGFEVLPASAAPPSAETPVRAPTTAGYPALPKGLKRSAPSPPPDS